MDALLIFGAAGLQSTLITESKKAGLYTVVIDPDPHAGGRLLADAFEVVGGNDFEKTCDVIEKYNIKGIVTAATDKPLVMMASVAQKYGFPFFSVETAKISTDKFLMKESFEKYKIPCAKGVLINQIGNDLQYPVILKPRDNSGSRGVIFCATKTIAEQALAETQSHTKKESVLAEEVIYGAEYSVESLHYNNTHHVIQITEKITTPFPYNVEMGHIQPTDLDEETTEKIKEIVKDVALAMGFENCASHTEIKINNAGIFVIESSPRLGGDYITSKLVPLSTGVNMEKALIKISLGIPPQIDTPLQKASAIFYFNFGSGIVQSIGDFNHIHKMDGVEELSIGLKEGDIIKPITNSLNRYGHVVIKGENRSQIVETKKRMDEWIQKNINLIKN